MPIEYQIGFDSFSLSHPQITLFVYHLKRSVKDFDNPFPNLLERDDILSYFQSLLIFDSSVYRSFFLTVIFSLF